MHVTLGQQQESLAGVNDRMTQTDRERDREPDLLSLSDGRLPDLRIKHADNAETVS